MKALKYEDIGIGSKVRVISSVNDYDPNGMGKKKAWVCSWNSMMTEYIGQVGHVVKKHTGAGFQLSFEVKRAQEFWFPLKSIELVPFPTMKFDLYDINIESRKALQERLFKDGYRWNNEDASEPMNLHLRFLYCEEDGRLLFGSCEETYNECKYPPAIPILKVIIEAAYKITEEPTIEIAGKKYYEKDVLNAISKIKPKS